MDAPVKSLEIRFSIMPGKADSGLDKGLEESCREKGAPVWIIKVGSMFTLFITGEKVREYGAAKKSDKAKYARYLFGRGQHGVRLPTSVNTERDGGKILKAAEIAPSDLT